MKRDEDGQWLRLEPRPDLALEEDAPAPPRRRPRPAPGKVTRTLSLPAVSPATKAAAASNADHHDVSVAPATQADPFPDVFGGALTPSPAPSASPAAPALRDDGELAAAKSAVDRAFAAQRDAILAAAAEQGPALQQAAAAAHTQIIGDIGARETSIRATFSQARDAVRNAANTQTALARSDASAVARRFRSASAVRKAYQNAADNEADRVTSTIHADGALITASANSVYSKLTSAHDNALHDADLPLKGTQAEEILEALGAARDSTRKEVQQWVTRDWGTLLQTGVRRAAALRKGADQLAGEVAAPLAEAADDVTSAGDLLASAISQGADQHVEALASAERTILVALSRVRGQAASVLRVGEIAGMRLRQDAATRVGTLGGPQAAAHRALDTVAPGGPDAIAEMRDYAVAAAADAGRDTIQRVQGASAALTTVVGERRTSLARQIDKQLAAALHEIGPSATHFANECTAHRAQAVQDYNAAETQLNTQALTALPPASATWRTDADQFIALAGKFTAAVMQQHRNFESGLDAAFVRFVRDEFTRALRSRTERAWDVGAGGMRALGQGVANFAVATAKYAAIVVAAPAIPLGALGASAYMLYNIYEGAERRVNALRSTWHQRSTLGKVLAVWETNAAIWGDQIGVTSMVEGVLHHEAITHRALSNEESGARYGEGAMNVVAGAILHKAAGGPHDQLTAGREAPQLPPGRSPAKQLPAGEAPPKQLPAGPDVPTPAAESQVRPPNVPAPDPYGRLADRGLQPQTIDVLRETGVDPAHVESLINQGGVPKEIALDAIDYGPDGIAALEQLASEGVPVRAGREVLRVSHEMGIGPQLIDAVRSGGLENPAKLRSFLKEVAGELSQGKTGKYTQLEEAISRARGGHRVSIEGRKQRSGDPLSGQADVIDHTSAEALQMKVVDSSSPRAVIDNLQKAVDQLGGTTGEVPPQGYQPQADIRIINDKNPLYMADRAALVDALRGNVHNLDYLEPVDAPAGHIVITNGNHKGPFVITMKELK